MDGLKIDWERSHDLTSSFIVFEGIDGSGKSTQASMLADRMTRDGLRVLLTGEPSQGPIGRHIRSLKTRLRPEEEVSLFARDRRDHLERLITPALAQGRHVICDRYIHSSLAYQGARGIDSSIVLAEHRPFLIAPDVIFLIDIPVDEALTRIKDTRSGDFSPFEVREDLIAVEQIFNRIDDPLVHRLDGVRSKDDIHQEISHIVMSIKSILGAAR
jgi:dTMP kinase